LRAKFDKLQGAAVSKPPLLDVARH
jgi:hypothetical protein